jgi:hypothetical protein
MIQLPDWKQLEHIFEWDAFVIDILMPFCVKQGWDVDYEFFEDRWCVVCGHLHQGNSQDWQRFKEEFVTPFCQARGWQVENLPEEAAIQIHAPMPVEEPEPEINVQQLNFFELCSSSPKQTGHYEEGE